MPKQKILIIDDESDYCSIMQNYLQEKDYAVSVAYTLSEGLNKITEEKPDILFLDNNLPDGKGWVHVESIVEKNPQLKVFLVSAYHQRGDYKSPSTRVVVWEKPLSLNLLNENF